MATSLNKKVTAENLVSANVRYSNKDDVSRLYEISANVNIHSGSVNSFEGGEVKKIQTDGEAGEQMASFNSYGTRQLNLYINNADETEAPDILSAIYAFMADVRANVSANPVQA